MMSKSSTITDADPNFRRLPPLHPGEMLREEFLVPLSLSPYALAKAIGVPRTRIERLAREETAITADTALRLGRYFNMTPQFWMNLQTHYELEVAQRVEAFAWQDRTTAHGRSGGIDACLAGKADAAHRTI
jgi:addiction module HigA family antidote